MSIDVEAYYRRYGPQVLRRCRFLLRDEERAVDAMHDVFVQLLRYQGALKDMAPSSLLHRMEMDDLVELLADELEDRQEEILALMHPKTAKEIRELLIYPENSAGRLMTRKFVRVNREMTAAEIITFIRKTNERYETVTDVYVLDPASRLIGVASMRQILIARPNAQATAKASTRLAEKVKPRTRTGVLRYV